MGKSSSSWWPSSFRRRPSDKRVLELDKNAGAESVALSVYDETGKLIRHIDYGRRPPGDFTVSWDGKNNEGTLMPDGNYGLVAAVRDMTAQILNYR